MTVQVLMRAVRVIAALACGVCIWLLSEEAALTGREMLALWAAIAVVIAVIAIELKGWIHDG